MLIVDCNSVCCDIGLEVNPISNVENPFTKIESLLVSMLVNFAADGDCMCVVCEDGDGLVIVVMVSFAFGDVPLVIEDVNVDVAVGVVSVVFDDVVSNVEGSSVTTILVVDSVDFSDVVCVV